MMIRNSSARYGAVAVLLHWTIAACIIGLLILGLYMTGLPMSPHKLRLYGLHKSLGITVLALVALRLLWRFSNVAPALPWDMPDWQKRVARAGHWLLYGLMIAQPMSGWLMSSADGFPVSVFGWFMMPNLIASGPRWREALDATHEYLGWALILTIAGHALVALHHHFIAKDNVLRRMLPWSMAVLLAVVPLQAKAAAWRIVPDGSSLTFTATQNDAPVTGEFRTFSGTIDFDPAHLDRAHVHIVVDTGSVAAAYDEVAATLKTPDWFSAALFPQAVFDAGRFTKTGEKTYRADGTLTVRGHAVPVTLNFTLDMMSAKTALAKGSTLLKRMDFGIGQGEWSKTDQVKDGVRVDFTIKAVS